MFWCIFYIKNCWSPKYQKKLTTAEEAVKVVKSGDWIDYGWCAAHPVVLDKALAARAAELEDLKPLQSY